MSLLLVPPSHGFPEWSATTAGFGDSPGFATTLTANSSANTKASSWTEMFDGALITRDCSRLRISLADSYASATDTGMLLDVAIDGSDSSDWDKGTLIANLCCGFRRVWYGEAGALIYDLPITTKAGSSIAGKLQAVQGSDTVVATCHVYGGHAVPTWAGSYAETIGAATSDSGGTAIACGNNTWNTTIGTSAGNWHSLGTTAKTLRSWFLGLQPNTGTCNTRYMLFELGWGDGSTVVSISKPQYAYKSNDEVMNWQYAGPYWTTVPAGATVYVRGFAFNSTDSEVDAIAYGVG